MDNVGAYFESLERTLEDSPNADLLRNVREILDDPSFELELRRFVAAINDPDVLNNILARMRRLRRILEERCERRKLHKDLVVQMCIVGGIGLIGGSIVAAASASSAFIVLIPAVGGIWMALQGFFGASRLDEERYIYEQLAGLVKHRLESVR